MVPFVFNFVQWPGAPSYFRWPFWSLFVHTSTRKSFIQISCVRSSFRKVTKTEKPLPGRKDIFCHCVKSDQTIQRFFNK